MPDSTYRANAFAPGTGARVHSGQIRVLAGELRFESERLSQVLPLRGLRPRRGGHNDEQIYFEHPEHPGWSVYSSDPGLARDPILSADPTFSRVLGSLQLSRSLNFPALIAIGVVVLFLAGLLLLWFAKDRIAEFVANRIPVSWEQQLGEQVYQQIARDGKLLESSRWHAPVAQITDRLLPVVANSGYKIQFHIMQDTNVNAFAIPGGHIVILTGLLESADSAEEVAGVLAHELAHITRRHTLRNMVKSAGLVLVVQTLLGDASGLVAIAAEGSRYLLQQKFSRDFEREADDSGWSYLLEARINPQGMIHFFEKLQRLSGRSNGTAGEGSLSFLSSHPASEERIKRLQARWESIGHTNFVSLGEWK